MKNPLRILWFCALASGLSARAVEPLATKVGVSWEKTEGVLATTPTLQLVVNPLVRRGSPIHDGAFAALKALGADRVRYVPWFPYPRLVVAELDPPSPAATSWDFTLIDPMTEDFMEAAGARPTVLNFSTIPAWMFKTDMPVPYPKDPDAIQWDYNQGSELRDPSGREAGEYFARLVSWYSNGGFTDENGKAHPSGHHYDIPIWEVLNEADFEHGTTPQQYAERYDAIVEAIHRVSPKTQFMAMGLGAPSDAAEFFEYFLSPTHHRPSIPIDYISYHFYATPAALESPDTWQYTFFDQADRFISTVRFVEAIRKRLSPGTRTDTDEIGSILPGDNAVPRVPIPGRYWNASGALFAYVYANLARMGVEVVGESQLVGYPSQFPSVTMIDWTNGRPNARYWVLKLLIDGLHLGDKICKTAASGDGDVYAQGFTGTSGRTMLLINRRNAPARVELPLPGGRAQVVDEATGEEPARTSTLSGTALALDPFAVAVVSWP